MRNIEVKILLNSFARSPRGKVTGAIWFELNDQAFPFDRWNDFVVVVLNWWIEALVLALKKRANFANLLFMDGPYNIVLSDLVSENVLMEFFDTRDGNSLLGSGVMIKREFIDMIATVAASVHDFLLDNNWTDDESNKLLTNLASLIEVARSDIRVAKS